MIERDLVKIGDACKMLHRTEDTLRRWGARGFAANGMKLRVYRDTMTKVRYFDRAEIERIAEVIFASA